jgi:hypothetical protein
MSRGIGCGHKRRDGRKEEGLRRKSGFVCFVCFVVPFPAFLLSLENLYFMLHAGLRDSVFCVILKTYL